ncbi:MAG: hypothetical protein Q7R75_01005 [bacterium]|nr:hypothetical protein [bacterium]
MTKCVKFSVLTPEIIKQIVTIYHNTVGGAFGRECDGEWLLEKIMGNQGCIRSSTKFRFGSKLSHNSKLWIHMPLNSPFDDPFVQFRFCANVDRSPKVDKEAQELSDAFDKAVNRYLEDIGLAV